jgi:hypothetical protein
MSDKRIKSFQEESIKNKELNAAQLKDIENWEAKYGKVKYSPEFVKRNKIKNNKISEVDQNE